MKSITPPNLIPLTHPGEHLREAMDDWNLTQYQLAKALGVQQTRIGEIIRGRRAISADTALRLARFFETSEEFWMRLQMNYDINVAKRAIGDKVKKDVSPLLIKGKRVG
ncbi:MAG: HigA family addiction module antitoxin [Xanthomonadales bacterium]|jgi:addiction module HigA family antidote|nr:HigA family addiction module antitoxin [Xanthomonadales bacterium]